MLRLVRKVGKKYKIGILSDNYKQLQEFIQKEYRLDKIFDAMVFSNLEGIKKPDPRIFRLAAKRLAVNPEECLFIDDKKKNVDAARMVGMKAFLFTDFKDAEKRLSKYF